MRERKTSMSCARHNFRPKNSSVDEVLSVEYSATAVRIVTAAGAEFIWVAYLVFRSRARPSISGTRASLFSVDVWLLELVWLDGLGCIVGEVEAL